jgi:hypothetical protein
VNPADDKFLMDLLKLHTEEVRFQVTLTWDRAKSSLTFHAALLALTAGFKSLLGSSFAVAIFLFIGASAILCIGILRTSHHYYRAARNQRKRVEKQLGTAFPFVTTAVMADQEHDKFLGHWPKVMTVLYLLHVMLAILAFTAAVTVLQEHP